MSINRLFGSVLLALALVASGCPKDGDTDKPTPEPSSETPAPTDAPAADGTTITYHWSGGLSIFEFYTMRIVENDEGIDASFTMKPVKGEERELEPELDESEVKELKDLLAAASFDELEQKSRGMKIHDIGRTVITVTQADGKTHEIYEDGDTTTTGDLRDVRLWFDRHIRDYLNAISKPEENQDRE